MPVSRPPARTNAGLFSRFALVGLATAAIYFALFALFEGVLAWDYRIAVSIAYGVSVAFHFTANRNVTFGGKGGRIGSQLIKYAAVAGINYAVTLLVTATVVEVFKLSAYLGVVAAVATTTVTGYILFRDWVFRSRAATRSS